MTEYLSLRQRPEFFNLRLRLRPPNFLAENFHLSRSFRKLVFFSINWPQKFWNGFFWVYKVVKTEIHQSKTLLLSKGKLAVTNKWLQKSRISYLMHFTSLLGLQKETSYLWLRLRPYFLKWELRLWSYSALKLFENSFLDALYILSALLRWFFLPESKKEPSDPSLYPSKTLRCILNLYNGFRRTEDEE